MILLSDYKLLFSSLLAFSSSFIKQGIIHISLSNEVPFIVVGRAWMRAATERKDRRERALARVPVLGPYQVPWYQIALQYLKNLLYSFVGVRRMSMYYTYNNIIVCTYRIQLWYVYFLSCFPNSQYQPYILVRITTWLNMGKKRLIGWRYPSKHTYWSTVFGTSWEQTTSPSHTLLLL